MRRSASGFIASPFSASFAATNESIRFRVLEVGPLDFTLAAGGDSARSGGTKDQCGCHAAPSVIHCFTSSRWPGLRSLCESGGGMTSSLSVVTSRRQSSLFAMSPGTTAGPRFGVAS